jgi:hypothetical protein
VLEESAVPAVLARITPLWFVKKYLWPVTPGVEGEAVTLYDKLPVPAVQANVYPLLVKPASTESIKSAAVEDGDVAGPRAAIEGGYVP